MRRDGLSTEPRRYSSEIQPPPVEPQPQKSNKAAPQPSMAASPST